MFPAETSYALTVRNGKSKSIAGRVVKLPEDEGRQVFYRFCFDDPGPMYLDSRVAWYLVCQSATLCHPQLAEIHLATSAQLYAIAVRDFWLQSAYVSASHSLTVARALWQKLSPWYEPGLTRNERTASLAVPAPEPLCAAASTANYHKPHVPHRGQYDGRPRLSCAFCGRWLEEEKA
jgi:hypothetical protein